MKADDVSEASGDTVEQPPEVDVRLGRGIRSLRLERRLSLADLPKRTGVSVGALSQIERGLGSLRVRVLWPLAATLDGEPHTLLAADPEKTGGLYVVRSSERPEVPVRSDGIHKELLSPSSAVLTGLLLYTEPNGQTGESYSHAGYECEPVGRGEVKLTIDSVVYLLKAGDSFAFKSTLKDPFRNRGKERCEVIWINTAKPSGTIRNGA